MRTEPHKPHDVGGGFLVDQHQIRFNVAVPMIFPIASEWMVMEMRFKWLIVSKAIHNRKQVIIQCGAVLTFGFPLVISLELTCPFNRPH